MHWAYPQGRDLLFAMAVNFMEKAPVVEPSSLQGKEKKHGFFCSAETEGNCGSGSGESSSSGKRIWATETPEANLAEVTATSCYHDRSSTKSTTQRKRRAEEKIVCLVQDSNDYLSSARSGKASQILQVRFWGRQGGGLAETSHLHFFKNIDNIL